MAHWRLFFPRVKTSFLLTNIGAGEIEEKKWGVGKCKNAAYK